MEFSNLAQQIDFIVQVCIKPLNFIWKKLEDLVLSICMDVKFCLNEHLPVIKKIANIPEKEEREKLE